MQEYLWPEVAANTESAWFEPKPAGLANDSPPTKDVGAGAPSGYDPVILGPALAVNETHSGSPPPDEGSIFLMTNPCKMVCAANAFCADPPVAIVPEQSVGAMLAGLPPPHPEPQFTINLPEESA